MKNIRHPDIPKMSDKRLEREAEYLKKHIAETLQCIQDRVGLIASGFDYTRRDMLPSWKIIDDLLLAIERFEAITEEILYRAEMMR